MNILKDHGKYTFFNSLTIEKELVPKNYVFDYDQFGNCFLRDAEDFKFPEKIYDVNEGMRKDIIKSFNAYDKNLGVLLTGAKGQGKSLNAKLLCKEIGLPVILVNKSIPKEVDFIEFFKGIKQDYCIFIDEFEKLFANKGQSTENTDYHEQDVFLSFMDGVITQENKILFLLTTNETVNEYFINRPSRVKFLQEYDELPEELFHQITDDRLNKKKYKKDLEESISLINMNIDLLISIIDDVNLFDRPFSEFQEIYNYRLQQYRYEMNFIKDGSDQFQGFFSAKRKIKPDTRYVNDLTVKEMLRFTKDEIIFKTQKWIDDDNHDEGGEYKDLIVKVTPVNSVVNEYVF